MSYNEIEMSYNEIGMSYNEIESNHHESPSSEREGGLPRKAEPLEQSRASNSANFPI